MAPTDANGPRWLETSPYQSSKAPRWPAFPRKGFPNDEVGPPYTWPKEDPTASLFNAFAEFTRERFDFWLGAWIFFHLVDARRWVHRRVETVQILGPNTARRQVSVDFSLPNPPQGDGSGEKGLTTPIVPLAVLRKEAITDFHIKDEMNRSVPGFTRYQNQFISLSLLLAIGKVVYDDIDFTPEVVNRLACLTYGNSQVGRKALRKLQSSKDPEVKCLMGSEGAFLPLCKTLAGRYLLLVPLNYDDGPRRILRFSYLERLQKNLRVRDKLAWRPSSMHLDIPAVDEAASYHCEIEIPEGLEVAYEKNRAGQIWTRQPEDDLPQPVPEQQRGLLGACRRTRQKWKEFERLWRLSKTLPTDDGLKSEASDDEESTSANVVRASASRKKKEEEIPGEVTVAGGWIHFKIQGASPGTNAYSEVWLRPSFSGFLRSARIYAVMVTLALLFLRLRLDHLESRAGATLLLSLAGLVSLFIVRPGEHSLATELLFVTRCLVWTLALLVYGGAALVATGGPGLPAPGESPDEQLRDARRALATLIAHWDLILGCAVAVTLLLFVISHWRRPPRQPQRVELSENKGSDQSRPKPIGESIGRWLEKRYLVQRAADLADRINKTGPMKRLAYWEYLRRQMRKPALRIFSAEGNLIVPTDVAPRPAASDALTLRHHAESDPVGVQVEPDDEWPVDVSPDIGEISRRLRLRLKVGVGYSAPASSAVEREPVKTPRRNQ